MAEEMDVPIPDMGRFEWDLPEDHEMSLGGKIAWRIAVYGAIVAIPAILPPRVPGKSHDERHEDHQHEGKVVSDSGAESIDS